MVVEILNATNLVDLEIGWSLSKDYLVRNGDIWIGFTSKPVTALALQKFNPTRYAPLNWANQIADLRRTRKGSGLAPSICSFSSLPAARGEEKAWNRVCPCQDGSALIEEIPTS